MRPALVPPPPSAWPPPWQPPWLHRPRPPAWPPASRAPGSGWQPTETLEKQLTDKGWKVRRIKEDGGCYEVYALDDKGERVEAYFHPVTLAPVPTTRR